MANNGYFSPGQNIVFREPWQGKVWRAGAMVVVQDTPELIAFYAPLGTTIKYPRMPDGKRVKPLQKMHNGWVLTDMISDKYPSLRLAIPGAGYSVILFWNYPQMNMRHWYINMEDAMHRTQLGFDLNDNFLDVIVQPDLSAWSWKDEDEFAEAVDLKLISQEKAEDIRLEGEKAANWIQSGKSPFNAWENWRPDPTWKVPVLPEGWDML
jgi:predicted RNA-binding protein associated with RNAse of E/G family